MVSTHTCEIPSIALSPTAHRGYFIPSLKLVVLLYLEQLCEDDYHVFLHKFTIKIYKDDKIILEGDHDFITGMWIVNTPHSPVFLLITPSPFLTHIPLNFTPSPKLRSNSVYEQRYTTKYAQFFTRSLFFTSTQNAH